MMRLTVGIVPSAGALADLLDTVAGSMPEHAAPVLVTVLLALGWGARVWLRRQRRSRAVPEDSKLKARSVPVREEAEADAEPGSEPMRHSCDSLGRLLARQVAVANRELLYEQILVQSTDLIALIDEQAKVAYASPSFNMVLGYSFDELVGRPLEAIVETEQLELLNAELARVITAGTTATITMSARHADGSSRWLDARASLLSTSEAHFVLFMARDVTERRALENQLIEAQKLESMGQLAGGVAHDFNNIITVLSCHVDWLGSVLPDHPEASQSIEDLRHTIDRGRGLTQQLLALARRQVLAKREVDLNEVVEELLHLVERVVPEKIVLRFVRGTTPALVRVDVTQIEQVLMNLVVNARDAMPGGGELVLTVDGPFVLEQGPNLKNTANPTRLVPESEERRLPRQALVGSKVVRLVVRDTGEGMSEETARQAFDPFFTTKPAGQGTGLGLPTSYGIVRQHGGVIQLSTGLGRGTEFEILLPAVSSGTESLPASRNRVSSLTEQAGWADDSGLRLWRPSGVKKCGQKLESDRPFPTRSRSGRRESSG